MKIMNASAQLIYPVSVKQAQGMLQLLESAGRTCYKSEALITEGSAPKFARMVLGRKHESVVEHLAASFRVICDRGVSHEIVRHRIASYSQESTRYVNYVKRDGVAFIDPAPAFPNMTPVAREVWLHGIGQAEISYNNMINQGCPPELARAVLPNSTKTEIVITMNIRSWRHFIELRCAKAAHPQMREVANMIREQLTAMWPELFEDLNP